MLPSSERTHGVLGEQKIERGPRRGLTNAGKLIMIFGIGLVGLCGLSRGTGLLGQTCTSPYCCQPGLDSSQSSCSINSTGYSLDCAFDGACCDGLPTHASVNGSGQSASCHGNTSVSYTASGPPPEYCTESCNTYVCVTGDCRAQDPNTSGFTQVCHT